MGEREQRGKPDTPDWAQKERQGDQAWIAENFHIFLPTVKIAFKDIGRGAIVVDTTQQPDRGGGHPFAYFSQEQLEDFDDKETQRLVREYNPKNEFVVMLLKEDDHTSTYRIRPQRRKGRR